MQGFFIPGNDGNYHSIVHRKEKADLWHTNNTFHVEDMNGDGKLDILSYDANQIFIKYNMQQSSYP